jgi:hypothetical protein
MRVMTWNVENLFRPGGMAGVTDPAQYEQTLENLTSMITAQRPDVIGLQEIGDPDALDDLKTKLGARYPRVLVASHFDPRHPIRVAALLRRGLRPVERDARIGPDLHVGQLRASSCAPPIATAFEGDPRLTMRVRDDGTWSLAVPLTASSSLNPRFGQSGRYAAAESPDLVGGDLLVGGTSTVLVQASHDTVVAPAKPRLVSRCTGRLAVAISVPGESSARYSLRWRGRRVASGWLGADGAAKVVLPVPTVGGRFEARAESIGAEPSVACFAYQPAPVDPERRARGARRPGPSRPS